MKKSEKKLDSNKNKKSNDPGSSDNQNFIKIITSPKKFISSRKDEGYFDLIRLLFIVFLPYLFLSLLVGYFREGTNIASIILGFINLSLNFVFLIFAIPALIYLGVLILKGNRDFFYTFRATSYMVIIFYLYLYVALFFLIVLPINLTPLNELEATFNSGLITDISEDFIYEKLIEFFTQTGVIVNLLISLIALIHAFIILVIGLSETQKFTKLRSFFLVCLSILIFVVVFSIVGILLQYV